MGLGGDSVFWNGFWNRSILGRFAGSGSAISRSAFRVAVMCVGRDVKGYAKMTSSSSGDILGVIMITPAMSIL